MTLSTIYEELQKSYLKHIRKTAEFAKLTEEANKNLMKAAELCLAENYDPDIYINAQARHCTAAQFFPSTICTRKAKENYTKYIEKSLEDPAAIYNVQKEYLRDAIMRTKRPVEEILMDDLIDFSPWFRIVITKEPIKEVIDKYRRSALSVMTSKLKQYLSDLKLDVSRIYVK